MKVSVPSRGLRYLNKKYADRSLPQPLVSVPSRGLRYLNVHKQVTSSSSTGFRPLSGIN